MKRRPQISIILDHDRRCVVLTVAGVTSEGWTEVSVLLHVDPMPTFRQVWEWID